MRGNDLSSKIAYKLATENAGFFGFFHLPRTQVLARISVFSVVKKLLRFCRYYHEVPAQQAGIG